jgi:hypothetical protein
MQENAMNMSRNAILTKYYLLLVNALHFLTMGQQQGGSLPFSWSSGGNMEVSQHTLK